MHPRTHLRLEGLALFVAASVAFLALDGPWWLYLVLVLAPDLGMAGYLAGPTVGARTYNALHDAAAPFALGLAGWWLPNDLLVLVALPWLAHIGIDRVFGYGLKYPTGFADTHLGRLGA